MFLRFDSMRFYFITATALILMFSVSHCDWNPGQTSQKTPKETEIADHAEPEKSLTPKRDLFGADTSLDAVRVTVRRNETLSVILRRHGLSHREIHELSRAADGIFDVRRIMAGRPLHLYFSPDGEQQNSRLRYIVYEENQTQFVRFALGDSILVQKDRKPVQIKTRKITGTIRGSLYQTMREIGVNPQLTHRMADVFAWQVDFYRIHPGDHFQVLFEEQVVDGKVAGMGRILAAHFNHRNRDYYAFHYRQDGLDEYFDEQGNSLRRQFMAAPLDYTRISSRFTNRRYHPVLRRHIPHHGIDYAAPTGTPIRSVGDGEVVHARFDRNNGNFVRIRHNSVYETGYLHMSRFANDIYPGAKVTQGQIIGYVGATGLATGPHLCFRFWKNGQPVNPQSLDLPPADPIKNEHRTAFLIRKEELLKELGIEPETVMQKPVTFAFDFGYNGVLSTLSAEKDRHDL